jgi:nicotinamidase-related amidase
MERSWFAIIDMQNIFATPGQWWGCPKFASILAPIQALAAAFGAQTLLTRFVAGSHHPGSWGPYYQEFPFANVPDSSPLYAIVDPLQPLIASDNTVTRTKFNKWGDAIDGLRAKTGATPTLFLAGVATDCCVLSTAIAAAEAGAFVTVILDACAGSSDAGQAAAEQIFKGYAPLIQISDTQTVLSSLAR